MKRRLKPGTLVRWIAASHGEPSDARVNPGDIGVVKGHRAAATDLMDVHYFATNYGDHYYTLSEEVEEVCDG